jgi:hypothetical protein
MDINREKLLTKVLDEPLEKLFRKLGTSDSEILWVLINKVVDRRFYFGDSFTDKRMDRLNIRASDNKPKEKD